MRTDLALNTQMSDEGASPSKWKTIVPVDDPRNVAFWKVTRVIVIVALSVVTAFTAYVLVAVPWDTTLELRQRKSGDPFYLPTFAMLIWPLACAMILAIAVREKPKALPYWECVFGGAIVTIFLLCCLAGALIWGLNLLNVSGA